MLYIMNCFLQTGKRKFLINIENTGGETPLHWTALNGHSEGAKLLIERGCAVDAQSSNGRTALHLAVINQHAACVEALVEGGCSMDLADSEGKTAKDLAGEEILALFNPEKRLLARELHSLREDSQSFLQERDAASQRAQEATRKLGEFIVKYCELEKESLRDKQLLKELKTELQEQRECAVKERLEQSQSIVQLQHMLGGITKDYISKEGELNKSLQECEGLKEENKRLSFHISLLKQQVAELQEKALTPTIVEIPFSLQGKRVVDEFELNSLSDTLHSLQEVISFSESAFHAARQNVLKFLEHVKKEEKEPDKK